MTMAKVSHDNQASADLVKRAYNLKGRDEQAELYRDWAETYDTAMVDDLQYVSPSKCAALLARHLGDKNSAILDIGCGTGLAGQELSTLGFTNINGIDISPEMMEVAEERGIYKVLSKADLLLPLAIESECYGGAICTGTFTHSHVGAGCLDEIARILKPGAVLAFTVHRDVHEELGFGNKLAILEAAGILVLLEHVRDVYFNTSQDPEGHYYYAYKRG